MKRLLLATALTAAAFALSPGAQAQLPLPSNHTCITCAAVCMGPDSGFYCTAICQGREQFTTCYDYWNGTCT